VAQPGGKWRPPEGVEALVVEVEVEVEVGVDAGEFVGEASELGGSRSPRVE